MFELRDVHKIYRMGEVEVHALRGVDLEIAGDGMTAVSGQSGSGKSTLLHLIGCLDKPTAGEIRFEGERLSALSSRERALFRSSKIGFVFQKFNLIPGLTAEANVALPLLLRGVTPRVANEQAQTALAIVSLEERSDHRPAKLSGGEQQRVAIARALVGAPAALLADEPTGNLDTQTGRQIMGILCSLVEDGKTVVVVTHDIGIADSADQRVILRDGRIVEETGCVERSER